MGAVAYLVNASEEVTLKSTDAQIASENYDGTSFSDATRKRWGPSDALRADLEKLLTKDQQAALEKGEFVELSLGNLPPDLQKRALQYANLCASLNGDLVAPPDASKWQKFQIRFCPERAGTDYRMLGVITVASNGTEYVY